MTVFCLKQHFFFHAGVERFAGEGGGASENGHTGRAHHSDTWPTETETLGAAFLLGEKSLVWEAGEFETSTTSGTDVSPGGPTV